MPPISKMTKADLTRAIEALGETPPEKWTVSELRCRLMELETEKGVERPN